MVDDRESLHANVAKVRVFKHTNVLVNSLWLCEQLVAL